VPPEQTAQPFHLGYQPALDGLRGAAVLAVMLYHDGAPMGHGGFLGVDAFFVLSGFLITSLLVEEWIETGRVSFFRFYLRRALRLLPALLVVLLAAAAVALTIVPPDRRTVIWRSIAATFLYVANWQKVFTSDSVGMLGHTWSLAIEEQFYMLWPPLLLLLLRCRLQLRWLTLTTAALALAAAGLRAVLWLTGTTTYRLYNGTHTRMDSLLIGCAAALVVQWGVIPRGRWPQPFRVLIGLLLPVALCVPIGTVASSDDAPLYVFGFFLFACGVAALVVALVAGQVRNVVLESPPMVWLGARSYGLYLWHLPVHEVLSMLGLGTWPLLQLVALNVAISLLLAATSYRFIEGPALDLKRRLAVLAKPAVPERRATSPVGESVVAGLPPKARRPSLRRRLQLSSLWVVIFQQS